MGIIKFDFFEPMVDWEVVMKIAPSLEVRREQEVKAKSPRRVTRGIMEGIRAQTSWGSMAFDFFMIGVK